jgi:O-antigen/teichoic acid export membrane protein
MRGVTLIAKFLLIFYIARKLSVIDLGLYGFITATLFASVYISGLEYGHFAARQIINCRNFLCQQKTVVNLTLFCLIMFVLVSPFSYLFISSKIALDSEVFILIFVIIYGESYFAEHKKILISLNMPFYSAIVDFVKTGFWAYLIVILVMLGFIELSIFSILFIWALFLVIACVLVFFKLIQYYDKKLMLSLPSIKSYRNQIYSSFPFFICGISLIIFEISGRLSLQFIDAQVEAGIYTLYSGFIFAIPLFVWSASVAFDHSKIMIAHENGEISKSDSLVITMIKRSLLICLSLVLFLFFTFEFILALIAKEEYINSINDFYLFLIVPFVHIIDSHLHYMLYTRKKDILNSISSLTGVFLLVIIQFLTIAKYGLTSVILSIIFALSISIVLKIIFIKLSIIKERDLKIKPFP